MPEGPEAYNMALQLQKRLVGKYILSYNAVVPAKAKGFDKFAAPALITQVYSVGKRPVIQTDKGWFVTFLGMTGAWFWEADPYTKCILSVGTAQDMGDMGHIVNEEFNVYYNDTRGLGWIDFIPDAAAYQAFFADFGFDLIHSEPTTEQWCQFARNRVKSDTAICDLLLNPKFTCTIGNYLRSEILYYAMIAPQRTVASLSDSDLENLRLTSIHISRYSATFGGLTIENYLTPDKQRGRYPHVCYKQNFDPNGRPISQIKCKQARTVFWVPGFQT